MVDINIKLDDNLNFKNKIPILIKDESWLKLFEKVGDRAIEKNTEELEKLLKEQLDIEKELERLKKEKAKVIKMILRVSNEVNNEEKMGHIDLLDEYREKLIFINETIEKITFRLENVPTEIRDINFKLLEATVNYGYTQLKDKEKKLDDTKDELKLLRERIRELINVKREYEEYINDTYTFIHRVLGSKQVEKLDDLIFK